MKRVLAAGLTLWLVLPTLALAAATGEAESQGMPQLNFHSPLTISQVVWMAIIFAALYVLLSIWALPQVEAVLANRARTIATDLDTARAAKAQADAAIAELGEATRRAHAEAQAAIAESLARAKAEAAAEQAKTNERLDARLAAAEQQIAAARSSAMGALKDVATETAQMLLTRLTAEVPAPGAVDAAVATTLAARGR